MGGKQFSRKANRHNDKEMDVGICPVCGRRGKYYKAQNAIVKKLRKLGRKLRYAKQLVYTHFEGKDRNDFCFTDTVEEAWKDEVWFTYHIK